MALVPYRAIGVFLLAGAAAGCATAPAPSNTGHAAGGYKVGAPYQVGDTWYYPHEQPDYDETGVASWYGPNFYGKPTADGELFTGDDLTAAHPTLPLPVNVRVTNLENGRSLVVRVNDRGPFANGRIIDVSRHTAELLGFYAKGTAKVRVTYLGRAGLPSGVPPEAAPQAIASTVPAAPTARVETSSLEKAGGPAAVPAPVQIASLDPVKVAMDATPAATEATPPASEQPDGVVTTVPVPARTRLYVQAGAFGSRENAERLKTRLAQAEGLFISTATREGKPLYRVRSGPYDDLEAANAALARVGELGSNDARIVVDQ
ncbi:MAG: septal ring lytic transglycosylase RlpA family protein [Alphaproteobacteria bacterium]|nr:septal ring lytic transglycosylase RlpA family protein [Alphaproteobacteria bacterium]